MGGVFYTVRCFDDWVTMVGKIRSIALCVFALLLACPASAFALVGPVDVESDGWNDSPYIAYTIAPDHLSAACNFFNVDVDQLNSAQRAYLATDDSWLAFYDSVELNNDFSTALLAFPFYDKSPDESLYEVYVDGSTYGYAQSVLMDVLSGELSGGSPSMEDDLLPVPILLNVTYGFVYKGHGNWTSGTNPAFGVVSATNQNGSALSSWMASQGLSYYVVICRGEQYRAGSSNGGEARTYFFASASEIQVDFESVPGGASVPITLDITVSSDTPVYKAEASAYPNVNLNTGEISNNASNDAMAYIRISTMASTNSNEYTMAGRWSSGGRSYYCTWAITNYMDKISIPTTPDPQPDPPIQPTDPGTDVPTVDPPTWPTIDFPDITIHGAPITITWPTIADNADYTQLLKEIIKRLEKIGDLCGDIVNDLDEHCEHLQQAIQDAAEYIVDNLELGIDPDLDDLVRGIDTAWRKITQTIKEQVKWLADQLDYDFTVTLDLDKIEQYLRRIISKMGGGTSKPDPTTDPFSWGDWLNDLWTKIFTALQIALPDELGELLELFDILKTKFPFSVPFDLIAIVALFDHAPVTPVFDLPYPMLLATGVGYDTVTIDCGGWNSTMVMVRDLEVVLFTAYLISRTQWALDSIDPKKGK